MNRLVVRLVLSHLLVVAVGAVVTFVVVRQLAPVLFEDRVPGSGAGGGPRQGSGPGLRQTVADSVTAALLVGAGVGITVGAIVGLFAARGLLRPLERVRSATRRLADGNYGERVAAPAEVELAALADDVNHLAAALEETEQRRMRLIGEVAHEMRTPLTVIEGYTEGMVDGVIEATPAQLAQIGDEVRRLRRLSEDLSALSRAEERRIELETATMSLLGVADAVVARLRPQAEAQDTALDLTGDPDVVIEADAGRVGQVVTNLVGNALRATAPGGRVELSVSSGGGTARLEVTDTGVGLQPGDLERVFERFYRAPNSTGSGGSGIGLTIARGIMRAHGGDLVAASPGVGGGATFTATFPRAVRGDAAA
ncbi:MAG: HAMP domain-containing sensor histidine kinase [Thermoleophilia bacterium]